MSAKMPEVQWVVGTENPDPRELVKVTEPDEWAIEVHLRLRDLTFFAFNTASETYGSVGTLPLRLSGYAPQPCRQQEPEGENLYAHRDTWGERPFNGTEG